MKIYSILVVLIFLFSCGERSEEDKIIHFLSELGVSTSNSSIVILNPDHCGSCTEETVDWLIAHDKSCQNKEKFILTTSEIPAKHMERISETSFKIRSIDSEKIGRLGIPFSVSTHLVIFDEKLIEEQVIK